MSFDAQMAEAMRRQREHVDDSHRVDRRGWTREQWVADARNLMSDVDGSVLDLVNGHVSALLAHMGVLQDVAEVARAAHDAGEIVVTDADTAHEETHLAIPEFAALALRAALARLEAPDG